MTQLPLTVEALRTAHAAPAAPAPTPRPANPTFRTGATARPATDKAKGYLRTLLEERAGNPDAEAIRARVNEARLASPTRMVDASTVSKAIDDLKAITAAAPAAAPAAAGPRGGAWAEVPDGYYAVPSATGNNDLDFFSVYTEEADGDWKGFRGVARVIGGHADQPVKGQGRRAALEAIRDAEYLVGPRTVTLDDGTPVELPARDMTGPEAAAFRYADEIGRCRVCNRHLTNETSRINAIGPVCAAK